MTYSKLLDLILLDAKQINVENPEIQAKVITDFVGQKCFKALICVPKCVLGEMLSRFGLLLNTVIRVRKMKVALVVDILTQMLYCKFASLSEHCLKT